LLAIYVYLLAVSKDYHVSFPFHPHRIAAREADREVYGVHEPTAFDKQSRERAVRQGRTAQTQRQVAGLQGSGEAETKEPQPGNRVLRGGRKGG